MRLVGAQTALSEAQAAQKSAQARVDEAELDIKSHRDKITALRGQQINLRTNKEFAAMNLEIATIEGKIEMCESRQVAALDHLAAMRVRVGECQKNCRTTRPWWTATSGSSTSGWRS